MTLCLFTLHFHVDDAPMAVSGVAASDPVHQHPHTYLNALVPYPTAFRVCSNVHKCCI